MEGKKVVQLELETAQNLLGLADNSIRFCTTSYSREKARNSVLLLRDAISNPVQLDPPKAPLIDIVGLEGMKDAIKELIAEFSEELRKSRTALANQEMREKLKEAEKAFKAAPDTSQMQQMQNKLSEAAGALIHSTRPVPKPPTFPAGTDSKGPAFIPQQGPEPVVSIPVSHAEKIACSANLGVAQYVASGHKTEVRSSIELLIGEIQKAKKTPEPAPETKTPAEAQPFQPLPGDQVFVIYAGLVTLADLDEIEALSRKNLKGEIVTDYTYKVRAWKHEATKEKANFSEKGIFPTFEAACQYLKEQLQKIKDDMQNDLPF